MDLVVSVRSCCEPMGAIRFLQITIQIYVSFDWVVGHSLKEVVSVVILALEIHISVISTFLYQNHFH